MKTGLLFGTFDGLHEGHRAMLTEARLHASRVIASLPKDTTVLKTKGRLPMFSWNERASALQQSQLVDDIYASDDALGEYHVLTLVKPDVLLLGYDQAALAESLKNYFALHPEYTLPIIILTAHQPDRYKSSLLNNL